jgi:hypothetical protein
MVHLTDDYYFYTNYICNNYLFWAIRILFMNIKKYIFMLSLIVVAPAMADSIHERAQEREFYKSKLAANFTPEEIETMKTTFNQLLVSEPVVEEVIDLLAQARLLKKDEQENFWNKTNGYKVADTELALNVTLFKQCLAKTETTTLDCMKLGTGFVALRLIATLDKADAFQAEKDANSQ